MAGEIERLAGLGLTRGTAVQLNPTQQRAMSAFAVSGQSEFSRADYEREAGVGKAVANEDLAKLVNHHLIRPRGRGPSRRYVLGSRAPSSTGRPVEWTDARIEAALAEFLDGRGKWPSVREFREAGRYDLYLAMTTGGVGLDTGASASATAGSVPSAWWTSTVSEGVRGDSKHQR